MRKNLTVGILREPQSREARTPLTPTDVAWLKKRKIDVEVESNPYRIFSDREYKRAGAKIVNSAGNAAFLLGVKGPDPNTLQKNKVYMVFSHTIKGEAKNMHLLKTCMNKGITLVDYEKITDSYGRRLVYFGRFAGICGLVDSLHYLGKKYDWMGIKTPFASLKPTNRHQSFKELKHELTRLSERIYKKKISKAVTPFIIGITGHGNVSKGANEVLDALNPIEVHPRDIKSFVRHQKYIRNRIYKIVLHREEKFRAKDGDGFYFEEYLNHPERFESNIDRYLPYFNLLMHTSYWDKRYPRLITAKMVRRLYKKNFRLEFIGDVSCDVKGSVELTHKTTTSENPTFTYNPKTDKFADGYKSRGITILAKDSLPAELPRDASVDFSGLVREYVYQIAAHGIKDITNHIALPKEIRQAVIVQNKRLVKPYTYLKRFV